MSENGKKKPPLGMGYIPYFEDYSVYRGIKLFAGQSKQRTSTYILDVIKKHYQSLMGTELDIIHPEKFHEQVIEASKKQKTRGVADFIEYCCSKHLEKMSESLKPIIKRG